MITSAYARMMAAYNSEMNRRLYAAAGRLGETERRRDRGAFFGSIHGTLSHLVWADLAWMAHFDGGERPSAPIAESSALFDDFSDMSEARRRLDRRIEAWSDDLDDAWLVEDMSWFSSEAGRTLSAPRALLVAHVYNHQTHHRGQTHAMLTAAGAATGSTDLPMVLPDAWRKAQA